MMSIFAFSYFDYGIILIVIYFFNLIFKISYNPLINALSIGKFSLQLNLPIMYIKLMKISWNRISIQYNIYRRTINLEIDSLELNSMTLQSKNKNHKISLEKNNKNNNKKKISMESTSNKNNSSSWSTFLLRWFSQVSLTLNDASIVIRSLQGE